MPGENMHRESLATLDGAEARQSAPDQLTRGHVDNGPRRAAEADWENEGGHLAPGGERP
jgi:hypothetical protein